MRSAEAIKQVALDGSEPDFSAHPKAELEAMAAAGQEVVEIHRILHKTNDNIVGELLKHQGTFYEWDHFPKGDVYDHETHGQYYYHAHAAAERFEGEHGHFHTFLRPKGMPPGVKPAEIPEYVAPKDPNDQLSHLIAISMTKEGFPFRLFTVNRWVTGEVWYKADDVCTLLDYFKIDHAQPSWPVNRWISAMVRLYQPQIVELVQARDRAIAAYQAENPGVDVYEDRSFEVTSYLDISVESQVRGVAKALLALE
ncbi:MAG: hypothetical protein AAF495_25270 [Pseudomonadota bacterium]